MREFSEIERMPAYGAAEASRYLRLPSTKAKRWAEALCTHPSSPLFPLSFVNLLELHVLKAMRLDHHVPLQRIRRALEQLRNRYSSEYPLLQQEFLTDGLDLLIREQGELINLSRYGQKAIREFVDLYATRIEYDHSIAKLFPFVTEAKRSEPKRVVIRPDIAFGRPAITDTGISTEVVASRFSARDSLADLAAEYQVSVSQIEEAIRWEMIAADAA